jgi:hypothetical protein
MMLKWRDGLKDIDQYQITVAEDAWKAAVPGWHLNESGIKTAKQHLKKYGLQAILDAIDTSVARYVKTEEGAPTPESVNLAWPKVGGILAMASLPEETRQLHYVKGILRNRLSYVPYDAMRELQAAAADGVDPEDMKVEAKQARSWSRFSQWLQTARGY